MLDITFYDIALQNITSISYSPPDHQKSFSRLLTFILEVHLRKSYVLAIRRESGMLELSCYILLNSDTGWDKAVVNIPLSTHQIYNSSSVTDDSYLINMQHRDRQLPVKRCDQTFEIHSSI